MLFTSLRVDRAQTFAGLFHALQRMRSRGAHKVTEAPHLASDARWVPGEIPASAVLIVEVAVIAARTGH